MPSNIVSAHSSPVEATVAAQLALENANRRRQM